MKAPTDKLSSHRLHRFAQIYSMRTIALPRGKQAYPPYHSPFKRRTNQSSPLQGELEGVANIPMFRMENNPCLSAICGRIKNTIRMANSCHNHSQLCCVKGKSGEGSDAPSTLERSGSERRVGAFNIPCPMRGKGLGESGGASLQGKGGRVGFRKRLYLLSYSMYLLP